MYIPGATLVTILFKKNDKSQSANYRRISLLTGFSKLFEILVFRRIN